LPFQGVLVEQSANFHLRHGEQAKGVALLEQMLKVARPEDKARLVSRLVIAASELDDASVAQRYMGQLPGLDDPSLDPVALEASGGASRKKEQQSSKRKAKKVCVCVCVCVFVGGSVGVQDHYAQ
jgi:hypothetical protein